MPRLRQLDEVEVSSEERREAGYEDSSSEEEEEEEEEGEFQSGDMGYIGKGRCVLVE